MADDTGTAAVTLALDQDTAAALADPGTRARVERLIRRTVRPTGVEALFAAMDSLSAEALRRGLTEETLAAELDAYNAERETAYRHGDRFRYFDSGECRHQSWRHSGSGGAVEART